MRIYTSRTMLNITSLITLSLTLVLSQLAMADNESIIKTSSASSQAVVVLYHHVAEDTPAVTSIHPEAFAEQMDYLQQNQFKVWPLPKIVGYLREHKPLPEKVIALTFDDNYESVYDTAFPLLKKYQYPFTIFVSTDALDGGYNMQASWEQLKEMTKHGATISNHTASHSHLLQRQRDENNQQWLQRVKVDIEKAQTRIEKKLGVSNNLFAYPYGETNQQLSKLVKEMGYIAFGQHSGPIGENSDFLDLPRFPFSGRYTDLKDFALKVNTRVMPIRRTEASDIPLENSQNKPELTIHLNKNHALNNSLQCFATGQGKINLEWKDKNTVVVTPNKTLPAGRSRYNCTAPFYHKGQNQTYYYWYTHPWHKLDKNNQWPPE